MTAFTESCESYNWCPPSVSHIYAHIIWQNNRLYFYIVPCLKPKQNNVWIKHAICFCKTRYHWTTVILSSVNLNYWSTLSRIPFQEEINKLLRTFLCWLFQVAMLKSCCDSICFTQTPVSRPLRFLEWNGNICELCCKPVTRTIKVDIHKLFHFVKFNMVYCQ